MSNGAKQPRAAARRVGLQMGWRLSWVAGTRSGASGALRAPIIWTRNAGAARAEHTRGAETYAYEPLAHFLNATRSVL